MNRKMKTTTLTRTTTMTTPMTKTMTKTMTKPTTITTTSTMLISNCKRAKKRQIMVTWPKTIKYKTTTTTTR